MPKVSVIIPVFNTEKYLRKCLNSVCNQTLKDIEIICVNDSSTDDSLEILKEYAAKDERIKLINFIENKGAAAARNAGVDIARGEYIGFVDSDDYIDLDFYEKLYSKAIELNFECVKGGMLCYYNEHRDLDREAGYDINKLIKKNTAYFYHSFTTAIYKKDFINANNLFFPENIHNFEDPNFSIHVAAFLKNIALLDDAHYHYVRHVSSVTLNVENSLAISAIESRYQIRLFLLRGNITELHYNIVASFLIKQLMGYVGNTKLSVEVNKLAFDLMILLYTESPDSEILINELLVASKNISMSKILKFAQQKRNRRN